MEKKLTVQKLALELGVHPNTIRNWCNSGEIPFTTTPGGQRRFDLKQVRDSLRQKNGSHWSKRLKNSNLAEDQVWKQLQMDLLLDKKGIFREITVYAFTEMLNNAIDHSEGKNIEVKFDAMPDSWNFSVLDDGVGAFQKIMKNFGLSSEVEAIAELTKGKRTTAEKHHSGEGIFFTSKAVTRFAISANSLQWIVDNAKDEIAVGQSPVHRGTLVECVISKSSTQTLAALFKSYSIDHDFQKTDPYVKLFESGGDFVSRSEAKRLLAGLEKFSKVTLDFDAVEVVGQGFVDEIFRIWSKAHPSTEINEINMNPGVEFMVNRAKKA